MSSARDNILRRLRGSRQQHTDTPAADLASHGWSRAERTRRLIDMMSAVRTEIHRMPRGHWVEWLNRELPARRLTRVLVGDNPAGQAFAGQAGPGLQVTRYQREIEHWKEELFHDIDVGITGTLGGIAQSGSLILWPSVEEPRLMSLVPPVHIALLDADAIYETFAQAMQAQRWADSMPGNALLISGPSKTADIEQTLAYGIHGPKQLIVLLLE